MDNLNTQTIASLYKAFQPEDAFRLSQRLKIQYKQKNGSWLDIAEIELSALIVQYLFDVRTHTLYDLKRILSAWSYNRNTARNEVS